MARKKPTKYKRYNRRGIVLLVTLVLLVVLSILGYTLTSRVAAQRHRNQYIIDYSKARYACESAVKYAIATLEEGIDARLIARPNEPDFSDLFSLSDAQYKELLAGWAVKKPSYTNQSLGNPNDLNDVNSIGTGGFGFADFNDSNTLTVRGPYGPAWPYITEPIEFEIGSATIRIEIEDENAKYPLGWALLDDEEVQREAVASLETFCEWMGVDLAQIDALKKQLEQVSEIKPFKLDFQPIVRTERKRVRVRTRRGSGRQRYERIINTIAPASAHKADFARLFNSSLIDTEALARPTVISETRKESALKYMGMWSSSKVNINTAPRQVLEAAFTFGGDAAKIAEAIIQRRQIEPFSDIEDLRKAVFGYSDSIDKCKEYITTTSTFFTVKVTAISGVSKASAVMVVTKDISQDAQQEGKKSSAKINVIAVIFS